MASPFYVQMPDLFGGQMAARQAAQQDFANKLSQLYAGGNQQAGQALAGIAPDKAEAIRATLEKLPGTEQAKVRQRADLLKKWHYAIAQEPDESRRALMWNQMLGQAKQSGADISGIAQSYSPEALQSQTQELLSFEELMGMQKERRLQDSSGGAGTEWERTIAELANGDPQDPVWRQKYLRTFMTPKLIPNQVTGGVDEQFLPADPVISKKALSVGLGVNAPSRAVMNAAPGQITQGPEAVSGVVPAVPTTVVKGEAPPVSRSEKERIAAEEREAERLKPMPTQLGQALIDNRKSVRQLESTLTLIDNPEAASTLGPQNMLPGANFIASYFGSPDENSLRGLISALQSMTYKDTSGATVTAAEESRLKQYIPTVNDKREVAKTKVERFLKEYNQIIADVEDFINSQGYKPFKPSQPAASPAASGIKFKGFK